MTIEILGNEINVLLPFLIMLVISTITSTGGVSGAFLLLPIQISLLGFNTPAVSATNHLFNIIATPGGVLRFIREGRMVLPLTYIVILGTLPGVVLGVFARIHYLKNPGDFIVFAGFVLLLIGIKMLSDQLKNSKGNSQPKIDLKNSKAKVIKYNFIKLEFEYAGTTYNVPALWITLICFIVGIIGGAYGIGGGVITAPLFVFFFGLPVYVVAGPALMGTFATSLFGVIFFKLLSYYYPEMDISPNLTLGLLFGLGGFLGTYIGAKIQRFISPNILKWLLTIFILVVAFKYISVLF